MLEKKPEIFGEEQLTREQIYAMEACRETDLVIEKFFGNGVSEPRNFTNDLNLCFKELLRGFDWFRLTKNHEDEDFWCEIRYFPEDYHKRGIYFKHLAKSFNPALAVCKAFLIFKNRRGGSFGSKFVDRGPVREERHSENSVSRSIISRLKGRR